LERVARIELANSRWQRDRLPLHHTRGIKNLNDADYVAEVRAVLFGVEGQI